MKNLEISTISSYENFYKSLFTITNETLKATVHEYCDPSTKQATIAKYGHIKDWNVTHVTDMSTLFERTRDFNEDISNWDVSHVTTMNGMFKNANSFNQPLNAWNVSQVTTMNYMFNYANSFNQPLNEWNVSHVTYMNYMFKNANSFNQPLNAWNVSQVTEMTFFCLEVLILSINLSMLGMYLKLHDELYVWRC